MATTRRHAERIVALLDAVSSRTGRHRCDVFDDFLDAADAALVALGRLAALRDGEQFEDPDPQLWQRLRERYGTAGASEIAAAFAELAQSVEDGYQDVIGTAYMLGSLGGHNGQFFTPMPLAALMAAMTLGDTAAVLADRLAAACEDPVTAAAFAAMAAAGDHWPALADLAFERVEPVVVSDPAVGSGVMLLAAASQVPDWALAAGLVRFAGTDIDGRCVKMASLNLRLYGLVSVAGGS